MLSQSAEESFQKGLVALDQGRRREAMALFEAAVELQRRMGSERPQARYLSYYGLCLGLELQDIHEALRFCREAVTRESYNANIRCNLGRVLMAAGRRKEAYESFLRGLKLQPNHPLIVRQIRLMGLRRRPALPFLSRKNPINVFLGRLRMRSEAPKEMRVQGHARRMSANEAA